MLSINFWIETVQDARETLIEYREGQTLRSLDCAELPEKRPFCFAGDDRTELNQSLISLRSVRSPASLRCTLTEWEVGAKLDDPIMVPNAPRGGRESDDQSSREEIFVRGLTIPENWYC